MKRAKSRRSNHQSRQSGQTGRTRNDSAPSRKIRYAVVGLGHIAQNAVLPAFAHATQDSELKALVTNDPAKAKEMSRKYKIERTYSYDEYEQCLESGGIDAVYIALPNSMHCEYSVRASKAGIHVLCEKPMAMNEQECRAMIEAAEDGGTKLMVAYRLHFEPMNLEVIETIRSGKIGEPKLFSSLFAQQVSPDNIRLKGKLGGGPVWDMGVYCINAARYLFRAEPREVFADEGASDDERFKEVEESMCATMRFSDDRLAMFTCSFGAADVSEYEVIGTKGSLRADPAYEYTSDLKLEIKIGEKEREKTFPKSDHFAPELIYFSGCILNNRDPEPSGREGLADVQVVTAICNSARSGKPVRVRAVEPEQRPSKEQEIRRPPNREPEKVHVRAPSE